ncbi:hypothetical protein P4O66_011205, partial [Electrophorus voltai]
AMARGCTGSQYWDGLVRQCMSCHIVCGKTDPHLRCLDFCARLAVATTTKPVAVTALQPLATSKSTVTRHVPYTEVLVYALLGLAFAILLSTVLVALLALLRRARDHRERGEKHGQTDGRRQPSKDWLMAEALTQEAGMVPDRPRATETCVHCFAEQMEASCTLYQQAMPQPQHQHHHVNGLFRNHATGEVKERGDTLRIICSPTQTSM